jgi:hypothetical protein
MKRDGELQEERKGTMSENVPGTTPTDDGNTPYTPEESAQLALEREQRRLEVMGDLKEQLESALERISGQVEEAQAGVATRRQALTGGGAHA